MARLSPRRRATVFALIGSVALLTGAARGALAHDDPADPVGRVPTGPLRTEQKIELPSARPAGDRNVDRIHLRYFPAPGSQAGVRLPAIILLPPIGSSDNDPQMKQTAKYFAEHGVSTALMTLPYHGEPWPEGEGRPDPGDTS
jgi:hypothetical protein